MRQLDEEGRYRLGAADLLTSKRCVLEGAVPPIAITQEEPVRSYGWVSKGLPTPATGGLYVVEFFGKSDIAILAYIDPFGRVFSDERSVCRASGEDPRSDVREGSPSRLPEKSWGACTSMKATGRKKMLPSTAAQAAAMRCSILGTTSARTT